MKDVIGKSGERYWFLFYYDQKYWQSRYFVGKYNLDMRESTDFHTWCALMLTATEQ